MCTKRKGVFFMEIKRARLIYNPSAGREIVKKNLAMILEHLEKAGYETSTFATKGKGDATREARRACEKKYDLVVAAGGDGTLYEVINGLSERAFRPKLAVLPMGTSNDFAHSIGVPKDLKGALDVIDKGITKKIDIGKMNRKYFINIAGGGVLTELTYEVPSKLKTTIGQLAYYIKGIEKVPFMKPFALTYEVNGIKKEEETLIFLVTNSNTVGGFDKLAPNAKIDDGLFDVFIVKKCNLRELARVMALLLKGEHIHDPNVIHFQTDHVRFDVKEDVLINLDGELGGTSPCDFVMLKEHIEMIVND